MESLTAKLCAFARAWHSLQSDHTVFNDFLAFDLMGREEYENVSRLILKRFPQESENSVEYFNKKYFLPIVLSRSRFAEDRVKLLARSGKFQYVICGAGVDTFSFRNKDPNVEVFELDLLPTQTNSSGVFRRMFILSQSTSARTALSKDSSQTALTAKSQRLSVFWAFRIIFRFLFSQKRCDSFRESRLQTFRLYLITCKKMPIRIPFKNCEKSLPIAAKPWPRVT